MKKSKIMSLAVPLFLVLALTLILAGNVSAFGPGAFFLTDKELPSNCRISTTIFKTWPGPALGIRTRLMGGSWRGKVYGCGKMVTVCVGYYPTEEEAKKWMNPDLFIFKMDVYAGKGHQGTTLSKWALHEYKDHSFFSSGTAYGDEGFTTQDISHDDKGAVIGVNTTNIFRIRNFIFHIVGTDELLDPLVVAKARRLLGEPVKTIIDEGKNWDLDADKRYGIHQVIRYIRNRAKDLSATDKKMSDLLNLYAKRISIAKISYKDRPFYGISIKGKQLGFHGAPGQIANNWSGTITLFNGIQQYDDVFGPIKYNIGSAKYNLSIIASLLMHEVAHTYGANEWQAHRLQKLTFDALGVDAKNPVREPVKKYFKAYPSWWNLGSQYLYWLWM